jgi:hypothetical protein
MARWLALEVLMTDEAVCDDEDLFGKLSALQEKWKQETLARRGVAQSVAGAPGQPGSARLAANLVLTAGPLRASDPASHALSPLAKEAALSSQRAAPRSNGLANLLAAVPAGSLS